MTENTKYDWRYENSINHTKQYLETEGNVEFPYNSWRTNSTLSNYVDTVIHANMMNMNGHLDKKLQYDYLFHSIRAKKRFFKKTKPLDNSDFLIIKDYYKYNNRRTLEVLDILTKEQIKIIKNRKDKGEKYE